MYETINDMLHRSPFKPFRVKLNNGKSYTVQRPDWAILLPAVLVICWPKKDRFIICDLPEIEALQPSKKVQQRK